MKTNKSEMKVHECPQKTVIIVKSTVVHSIFENLISFFRF